MTLRVAAVSWKLRHVRSDGQFYAHLYDLIQTAHDRDVQLLVLPELAILELLSLAPDLEEKNVPQFLVQFASEFESWLLRISASSGITLVGGSHFRLLGEAIGNASATATPEGSLSVTYKNRLTTYERDFWNLKQGEGLSRLPDGRFGVLVCYDSEFPEAGRALAEAGVQAILVPAFTETIRGFQRVRWACQARALENQVFVVHASLVGSLGYEPAPSTFGSSAILTPSIEPFPSEAVLDETHCNEEGLAIADLDFDLLAQARGSGDVRNWEDRSPGEWPVS